MTRAPVAGSKSLRSDGTSVHGLGFAALVPAREDLAQFPDPAQIVGVDLGHLLSAVEILKILRPAPNHAKLYTRRVEGCIPVKRIPLWERSR